jgi:hypothetical protein
MPSSLRYATISSSATAASGRSTTTAQALLDKLQIAEAIYAPR